MRQAGGGGATAPDFFDVEELLQRRREALDPLQPEAREAREEPGASDVKGADRGADGRALGHDVQDPVVPDVALHGPGAGRHVAVVVGVGVGVHGGHVRVVQAHTAEGGQGMEGVGAADVRLRLWSQGRSLPMRRWSSTCFVVVEGGGGGGGKEGRRTRSEKGRTETGRGGGKATSARRQEISRGLGEDVGSAARGCAAARGDKGTSRLKESME